MYNYEYFSQNLFWKLLIKIQRFKKNNIALNVIQHKTNKFTDNLLFLIKRHRTTCYTKEFSRFLLHKYPQRRKCFILFFCCVVIYLEIFLIQYQKKNYYRFKQFFEQLNIYIYIYLLCNNSVFLICKCNHFRKV